MCTVGGISLIISIHALRKESDFRAKRHAKTQGISIHALRKESDLAYAYDPETGLVISIHALRKESD